MRLCELAAAKRLPEDVLRSYGVTEVAGEVHIPYYDETGYTLSVRRRTAVVAKEGSRWRPGDPLVPYGLDQVRRLNQPRLILVEGESDAWTCWYHGFPALGIPGVNTVKKALKAAHLEGVTAVYLHQENDAGG